MDRADEPFGRRPALRLRRAGRRPREAPVDGLARYLHGHHPNPLRRGFDALRKKGYKLVAEVAAQLGVSVTTLRRMEAEAISKTKRITYARGKEARVYTDSQVKVMIHSKICERWRRAHSGRWRP